MNFYRSFYVLLDRQRDRLTRGLERELGEDLAEIETFQQRIEASERAIARVRNDAPAQLAVWMQSNVAAEAARKITDMVQRCRTLVDECQRLTRERAAEYRHGLSSMAEEAAAPADAHPGRSGPFSLAGRS